MGLEQAIWREEQQVPAPAPALSFATARLEALNVELHAAEQSIATWSRAGDGGSDDSMRRVVQELGIHRNEARAAEHEDFISTINRQVRIFQASAAILMGSALFLTFADGRDMLSRNVDKGLLLDAA
jgi:hypothetical protein